MAVISSVCDGFTEKLALGKLMSLETRCVICVSLTIGGRATESALS